MTKMLKSQKLLYSFSQSDSYCRCSGQLLGWQRINLFKPLTQKKNLDSIWKPTCKLEGIGPLSFNHVKWTGMSPEVTLQLT